MSPKPYEELLVAHDVPEADWKVFREIRQDALERFSDRILRQLVAICEDRSRSAHDRYLDVWRILRERDEAMARTFDNPRRSTMYVHLAAMEALDLLAPNDLSRMTSQTQLRIRRLSRFREQ